MRLRNDTHYPSWGSGTAQRSQWPKLSSVDPWLITPHGDREPRSGSRRPAACSPDYPSWGSGTWHPRPRLSTCGPRLITPHGDREHVIRIARTADRTSSLPLIGNPTASAMSSRSRRNSLPLMGIGNWQSRRSTTVWCRSHYPSWGSGTVGLSGSCACRTVSLPLMGIGNRTRNPLLTRQELYVITPHGDRQLGHTRYAAAQRLNSLPLMGIGNVPASPSSSGGISSSLPLMGIGNSSGIQR